MEEGGVEFGTQQEAALEVPTVRGTIVTEVPGEGFEVPSGIGEFEDAGGDPARDCPRRPIDGLVKIDRRKDWKLAEYETTEVGAADFSPRCEIQNEAVEARKQAG